MEMLHITGRTYTMDLAGTSAGIYMLDDRKAVFIDTGEADSRELIRFLRNSKIIPVAIINTHLHIDHIGNHKALCDEYGVKIYTSPTEVEDRCSGCADFEEYLIANCEDGKEIIEGAEFTFIPTPGHSTGHQAVVTPDGVCCLGDSVMSMSKLRKSRIPYVYDSENAMKSLKKLLMTDYPYYLAAHNGPISGKEIRDTIRANIEKEENIREIIKKVVTRAITMDRLEEKIMMAAGVTNPETRSFFWMHDSVRTRIEELIREGRLEQKNQTVFPAR